MAKISPKPGKTRARPPPKAISVSAKKENKANKARTTTDLEIKPSDDEGGKFPYSVGLVATVAAHFVESGTPLDRAAVRAIALLDAVERAIPREAERRLLEERDRQLHASTPPHLDFQKGIRYITHRRDGKEVEAFEEFLRLIIQADKVSLFNKPPRRGGFMVIQLREQKFKAKELTEIFRSSAGTEEERIQFDHWMVQYRKEGFDQRNLYDLKRVFAEVQRRLVIPFQNSLKGKKGGPPEEEKLITAKLERICFFV